jgi:hypothetical protein
MTKKKSSKSKQIDRKGNGCFDVKPARSALATTISKAAALRNLGAVLVPTPLPREQNTRGKSKKSARGGLLRGDSSEEDVSYCVTRLGMYAEYNLSSP